MAATKKPAKRQKHRPKISAAEALKQKHLLSAALHLVAAYIVPVVMEEIKKVQLIKGDTIQTLSARYSKPQLFNLAKRYKAPYKSYMPKKKIAELIIFYAQENQQG